MQELNGSSAGGARLAAIGVLQAAVLAEAVADAREQVRDQAVVARECARHDVPVHDHCGGKPPKTPLSHIWSLGCRGSQQPCHIKLNFLLCPRMGVACTMPRNSPGAPRLPSEGPGA